MKKKSKNILVTGGCGFVGSYVVDELVKRGHVIDVVDDMSSCWLDEETAMKPRFNNPGVHKYAYQNVLQINDFQRNGLTIDYDSIVHLAKTHPMKRDKSLFENSWEGYVSGGVRLLLNFFKYKSPLKRFITIGNINEQDERGRMLPHVAIENAFQGFLDYHHLPPLFGAYMICFPELQGDRRLPEAFIRECTKPVEWAAKIIADFADCTECHKICTIVQKFD